MKKQQSALDAVSVGPARSSSEVELLEAKISEIGLARFVGRINSGLIPPSLGYEAVQNFLAHEKQRPFLSRLTQALVGRTDAYLKRP